MPRMPRAIPTQGLPSQRWPEPLRPISPPDGSAAAAAAAAAVAWIFELRRSTL